MQKNKLNLTNLDKIYFPKEKITKGDVIAYYDKIAPFILPYLKDRPQSLHRHPNGIAGESFFQKDVGEMPPDWVRTEKIYSESNKKYLHYLFISAKPSLLYAANLGCIEMNPWFSTFKHLDKPDYLVLDLDPENIDFKYVVEVALSLHKLLDKIGARNYCKTSGARGLHIYVPLGAKYTYKQAKQFTHLIAMIAAKQLPKIVSLERHPAKRQRKVYIDYLQNAKAQTLACPYSLRPKPGATVATPLEWKEVKPGLDPKKFNIRTIFPRIKKHGDLIRPILGKGVNLKKALSRLPH